MITCCHITRGQRSSNVGEPHRQHLLVAVKFVPSYGCERSPNGDSFLEEAMQCKAVSFSTPAFHSFTMELHETNCDREVSYREGDDCADDGDLGAFRGVRPVQVYLAG